MAITKEFIGSQSERDIRANNLKDLEPLIGTQSDRVFGPEDRTEVDDLTSGIERFRASFKTGQKNLVSSFQNFDASIASITGNEERMNESLRRAKEEQEQGAYYLLDSQSFEEFMEAPTFDGFIDSAIEATGQFAPTAITSVIAALAGAGVGASLSYLTGSSKLFAAAGSTGLSTIPASLASKKFVQTEVEDILKKKVTLDVLKKQGKKTAITMTPDEEKVIKLLYPYLRGQLRNKYATVGAVAGAFAQEQPMGAGIAFGDYAEQGMTDPITSFRAQQQGIAFGAIGVGSEALIYKAITNNIKSKAAKNLINERAVIDAPSSAKSALDIVSKGLGAGLLTGASEGIAELGQEELSVQQKFRIDNEYTKTQANLDRLQALYMGAIGGMGIGTGTGTGTAVLGKMRELAEIGYEKKMFDLYQQTKQGETNPILETQSDLSAQFADLIDPKIGREFVWADAQNYSELGPISNRVNKTPGLERTMIPGVGTFFSLDPTLNQRFVNSMSASPLNRQRLLNFLDIYGNNPPTEGKGQRVVVSVRGQNSEVLKRYDVQIGEEEQTAITAAQNYIGGPDGTNNRNIVVQTLEAFNEERAGKLPVKEEQSAMEEDLDDYEASQTPFETFSTEQERLFAQDTQTEPQIIPDLGARTGNKKQEQQGSFENPIANKQTGKPFAKVQNEKFVVKKGDEFYNRVIEGDEEITALPAEFVTEFDKLVSEGKISQTAVQRYAEVNKILAADLLGNQAYGFSSRGDGVVIFKYDMPGVSTAVGTQTVTPDLAERVAKTVGKGKTNKPAQPGKPRSKNNFTRFELEKDGEKTPVDPNKFINVGRNLSKAFGNPIEGDFQSAIGGFGFLMAEMANNGYTLLFEGKPFSDEQTSYAPVYNKDGRALTLDQMQASIGSTVPRARRGEGGKGRVKLTEDESREGIERDDIEGLEAVRDLAEEDVAERKDKLVDEKIIAGLETEALSEGLTEQEKKAGVFVSKKGKKVRPFTPKGSTTGAINRSTREQQLQRPVERAEKNLEYSNDRLAIAEQNLFDAQKNEMEQRIQDDPTDQYAYDSSALFREWGKKPAQSKEQQKLNKIQAKASKEFIKYSTTIEKHLGVEVLDTLKNLAKNTLGINREILFFSTEDTITLDDKNLEKRAKAAQAKFGPTSNYRGINVRGRGNTDVLIIQTRDGFNVEDQGARLFTVAHEIGHTFIYQELDRSLKNPTLRNALQKAFEKAKALGTTKQYQLEGDKGFQEWVSDQIAVFLIDETKKATNQTESFFKNIATKVKAFFTKYSAVAKRRFTQDPAFNDYIQEVMSSNKNNKFQYQQKAKIEEQVEAVQKVITKGAEKNLKRTVDKIIETGEIPNTQTDSATRTLRTIFQDTDGLLRSFGKPGKTLARLFKQRVGTTEKTGYLTKVFSLARAKMNEIQTILNVETAADMNEAVEETLQELENPNTPFEQLSPQAQNMRTFLIKHYNDLNLGELGVGFLENYFPRMYKMEELLNDPGLREDLVNLLAAANPQVNKSELVDAVTEMLSKADEDPNFSREEDQVFEVGMLAKRAEFFRNLNTQDLRNAGLLEDASYALQRYIQNSVKRRGFADIGGSKAIEEQLALIKDPKERKLAEDSVKAILGRVDPVDNAALRNINNAGLFFNVATLLPLSVFASFPDVAGPILRYRGIPNFLETMRTITAAMSDEELNTFGKDIGAVGINAMNEQYVGAGELQYTSKGTKKATNQFFRFIQLEQFTNFTRRFAAGMARVFLLDNASKALEGDETAQRYLAELDVTAEEVIAWGGGDITAPSNQRVRLAAARFVDEAIVRPNAAERPIWASDPRFALVWQLKSFFYSYGKNIVMGTGREMQSRMTEAGMKGATIPLFMAAVTLMPLTMLGLDLRERFKIGLAYALPGVSPQDKNYRRSLEMDYGEYSTEILDRSGVLGPYTMALPLFVERKRYGDPLWVGPLGPTIGTGYDLIAGDIKPKNLIPFYSAL